MNPGGSHVLLADIGGTNARFALADRSAAMPLLEGSVREFPVMQFASLAEAARHYLGITGTRPRHAVFAVAGRVTGNEARITNHPWLISATELRLALGLDTLRLVNDFSAQAMALPLLRARDVVAIGAPAWTEMPAVGDRTWAIVGPGTGLGVGALLRRDGQLHVVQSEGGHAGFAPATPEEIAVLEQLSGQFDRASNERLLSGPGLVNLHQALCAIAGERPASAPLQPQEITARAHDGDAHCLRVLELFCAIFGAVAGDLVLTFGAWDGVVLTGGLVPKLLQWLPASGFRIRFEHKGRFADAMAQVPVLAVLHPHPGLLGAAAMAVAERRQEFSTSG